MPMTIIETANRLQSQAESKDRKVDEIISKIEDNFTKLEEDISSNKKYDIVVSTEYLIIRLRSLVEFEHIIVKRLLSSDQLIQTVKIFFSKRDVYLAQLSQKITTLQNDISIISKLTYQQQFNK